jgi:hypothetical protein
MLIDDRPLKLTEETTHVLDEIRAGSNPINAADDKFEGRLKAIIAGTGLPRIYVIQYGWFLTELGSKFRTRSGRELAFHLELCIRKWLNLGLESRTVQFLICEAYYIVKATRLTTKHALSGVEGTPSHQEDGQNG